MHGDETIAAIVTGMAEAGVAVIRISGGSSVAVAERVFLHRRGAALSRRRSHSITYGSFIDESGSPIDEGLGLIMRGPRSYTGEDVVELHCHGGLVAVREVLRSVLSAGARLAEPGEFTRRAFLNGRIDLSQAESVIDVIRAKTDSALRSAIQHLRGGLSMKVGELRHRLLGAIAHLEADIDFPELELETQTLESTGLTCVDCVASLHDLLAGARRGEVLREGLRVALVGRPNVGKSSLMNALAREDRSIVTPVPGTTRDVVEHWISLSGLPVLLADTAGVRESDDVVERIGVERALEWVRRSDLVLFVMDATTGFTIADSEVLQAIPSGGRVVGVVNKADLVPGLTLTGYSEFVSGAVLGVSATAGQGIEALEQLILEMAEGSEPVGGLMVNTRHEEILQRTVSHLEAGLVTLGLGMGSDLVSIDLRSAWSALGEITGETIGDDLLDQIFGQFCIGK